MKKILCLASMSISMLAVVTMSGCSEHKTVTSDLEGGATSITRLDGQPQVAVRGFADALQTRLAALKSGESYVWSSDNPSVITVDQQGLATGVAFGTANIHVKHLSSGKVELESETFAVTVGEILPIRDSKFKAYLVGNTNLNKNGNSEIELSEAMAFNGEINTQNDTLITSLGNLKYFKNLKRLNCANAKITYLDLSANSQLESLDCTNCKELIGSAPGTRWDNSLNLTQNIRLTAVNCLQTDKLKEIVVSTDYRKLITSLLKDKDDKLLLARVAIAKG